MRIIKAIVGALVAVGVLAAGPAMLRAQGITYNQVITWAGSATTSTAGPSDIIRDVNQTGAWLYVCNSSSSSTATATFELEGSYNKVQWFQISTVGSISAADGRVGCQSILASGYFPFTRLNVLAVTGTLTVSANYSASFTPIDSQGAQRLGQQTSKTMPEAASLVWASAAVSDTPIEVTTAPATVSSVQIYNPNSTVVYFALNGTNSLPTVDFTPGSGYEVAVPAASAISVSLPVPLASQVAGAGTGNIYVMCSSAFSSLAAPVDPCTATVVGVLLPLVNIYVNAAGAVQSTVYDPTPW